jgi:7-cyano-7-deazaguanine synthase
MSKALVVFSGGQDSTTCLAQAVDLYGQTNVHTITFDYGQRHAAEIQAAERIVRIIGVESRSTKVLLPEGVLKGSSPLVDKKRNVETYASPDVLPGGLEKTFVPMRNQLFLTIAANHAAAIAAEAGELDITLITGISQEDYGGYPDCRNVFLTSLQHTINMALDDPALPQVHVIAPLLHKTKADTVRMGNAILGCNVMLAYSHTCYNGSVPPCGECHACLLRAKGFAEAGSADPLLDRLSKA